MKRHSDNKGAATGPSQRQLRAGELIRHALVEILREEDFNDEALTGVSVTVTEVRMSPDLRHAVCFVEPLGGENADVVVKALNRHAKFLRGRLGRLIDMKFTPDLKFLHDQSFDEAARQAAAQIKMAVLTRSAKGSVIFSGEKAVTIAPETVPRVVDTTGAGDLYAAGFLYGLTQGKPLETCGRLGSLAAAEIISHIGARPATPLDKLARQRGL